AMPACLFAHSPAALLLAIALFGAVSYQAVVAMRASHPTTRKLAMAAAAALCAQPLIGLAVDHGLPLISYGGSYIVAYFACVGLLLRAEWIPPGAVQPS